jgi:hypothetical protein
MMASAKIPARPSELSSRQIEIEITEQRREVDARYI